MTKSRLDLLASIIGLGIGVIAVVAVAILLLTTGDIAP